jgi:hypothetical protein
MFVLKGFTAVTAHVVNGWLVLKVPLSNFDLVPRKLGMFSGSLLPRALQARWAEVLAILLGRDK